MATTCFQNRLLIRPDDFRLQAAGAGIEPTSRRSERPVLPLNDPASVSLLTHICRDKFVAKAPGAGIEPATSWFKATHHIPTATTPERCQQSECPAGIEVRLSSLEGWCLSRSAKGTCCPGGRGGSRTRKAVTLVPLRTLLPSPVGLPFRTIKAAVAGIGPASGRLTAACPYQHGPHRIASVSQDGWI